MVRVYFTEQNSRMLPQQIMGMQMTAPTPVREMRTPIITVASDIP